MYRNKGILIVNIFLIVIFYLGFFKFMVLGVNCRWIKVENFC